MYQRFKFEAGRLKTAGKARVILSSDGFNPRLGWENACLTAYPQESRFKLYRCGGVRDPAEQAWGPGFPDLRGGFEIRSNASCFDIPYGNTTTGTPIVIWGCANQPNQRWTLRYAVSPLVLKSPAVSTAGLLFSTPGGSPVASGQMGSSR